VPTARVFIADAGQSGRLSGALLCYGMAAWLLVSRGAGVSACGPPQLITPGAASRCRMTLRPRAPSALKVAGAAVALAVAAGCGAAYYAFVTHQRDDLVGRNFRLLDNLGAQLEKLVDAEASVVANLASDRGGPCAGAG
jgi:hypothetical protein